MDLDNGEAAMPATPPTDDAPQTPPPSLTLSGDQADLIPDHTLGAEGTLLVHYCVRSASQPSDGQPGDKSISLDLDSIEPKETDGDGGEGETAGGDEGNGGDAEEAEAAASNSEGEDVPGDKDEEKALGYKRSKRKAPPFSVSAKGLSDY